jgi:HK97 family phage major capsid protein
MQLGEPDRLLGKPLYSAQNMLAYTDTYSDGDPIACFGDFSRYGIRYVRGMRLRRTDDLYLANDQVGFVGFMRADGQPLFAVDESTSGGSETSPILALTSDDGA